MSESKLKAQISKYLTGLGPRCWFFMPLMMGYGRAGVPDFIGFIDGKGFAIETKYGGNKLSPWQERERDKIIASAAIYVLAYDIDAVKRMIR